MQKIFEQMLRRYGSELALSSGGKLSQLYGFFLPVTATSWQSMERQATPLGDVAQGQYTYIGPARNAQSGDFLYFGSKTYLLQRVETYYYRNRPLYHWGLCLERSVEDTWGANS